MKKSTLKTAKISLVISSLSILVAAVNLLISVSNKLPTVWAAITLQLCMLSIFFSNLSIYTKRKKESEVNQPTDLNQP